MYLLAPALWTLGLWVVPELGSSDFDGMAFESRFSGAVDTLYALSAANSNGAVTDAVFSHEGAITIWTLMNVNNPDFPLVATELFTTGQLLPYTGIVEVRGDPADGWTLVSWNGAPVPQDPGLPTDLFVDVRDLITAPQMAAYTVGESLLTGDLTTILTAVGGAVGDVGAATVHFPIAVIDDIVNAVTGALAAL